jgi:diguanylate cyclase (GGDEF)-like protein/PAS domain S-box-containing protein
MPRGKKNLKNGPTIAIDEELFRRMFDEHAAVMLSIDPQSGYILDANKAAIDFYGYPKSKLYSMTIQEINVLLPEQVAEERQKALSEERNYFVFTHMLAGGKERIVEVYSSPIALREKRVLFSIIHDITERRQAEAELRKSEERYRTLFNGMMDGIYRSSHEGRFVDVNPAMVRMFGYSSREEMMAVDIKKELYFSPEERGSHILDTGREEIEAYRMRRKDGSEIWVEDHGYYVHDEQGNILYHEGMLRDITARKQVEDALRESEQNYRNLANSGQALIWSSGIDGRCNYFNETWLKFTGRMLEQELGDGWIEGMHPEDYEDNKRTYLDAFKRREIFSLEYRLRRWDGEYRWLQDDGSPQYNTAGEFIGYIGHCLDITERKRVAEIIRESEERLTAVVEGSQLGYSDWNIKTGEIRRNERWAGMLGYTLKEIENTYQQWEELLHPDDCQSARQSLEDHLHGRTSIHRDEYRLRAKDGSYRWILDQGKIVEYDPQGNPLRMTATHTDITARKQAEAELLQAKEALEATHRELEKAFAREQQLARIDMLTGVNNRRYLFELATYEFKVAARYVSPLSVLMFDVDHFKLINDNFGHAIGDQALQHLVQIVRAQLRSVDVLGRYGGDEFIILLPRTDAGEAKILGERIHSSIASMRMETNKGLLSLTISLGIAQILHNSAQPDSLEDLLQRADQALYTAKQAGRNRTVIFNEGR